MNSSTKMEWYTGKVLLSEIYAYMSWGILSRFRNVPDSLWQRICKHFCKDEQFKQSFEYYGGMAPLNPKIVFLHYINVCLHKDMLFEDIPKILLYDRDFVLLCIQYRNDPYIPVSIFGTDRQLVLEAMKRGKFIFEDLDIKLKQDKEIVFHSVNHNGLILEHALAFQDDMEIILSAVKQNGLALRYSSLVLKSDRQITLEAVRQNGLALQYSSLTHDREIVFEAVTQNGDALQYAHSSFVNDKELISASIRQEQKSNYFDHDCRGKAFKYASEKLKADKGWVLKMVQHCGLILEHVAPELQRNREIVLAAIKQNGEALKWAKCFIDRNLILSAVKSNGRALYYAGDLFKSDLKIVKTAIMQDGSAIRYADMKFKDDDKLGLLAVKKNGAALFYLSNRLKTSPQIILEAFKPHLSAVPALNKDKAVICENLKRMGYGDPELISKRAIRFMTSLVSGSMLSHLDESMRANREIISTLVKQDGNSLYYASSICQSDCDIVYEAISKSPHGLGFASPELRHDRNFILNINKQHKVMLRYTNLRSDTDIVHELARNPKMGLEIYKMDPKLKTNPEIMETIIKTNIQYGIYTIPVF